MKNKNFKTYFQNYTDNILNKTILPKLPISTHATRDVDTVTVVPFLRNLPYMPISVTSPPQIFFI